jgi:hypothetical protein
VKHLEVLLAKAAEGGRRRVSRASATRRVGKSAADARKRAKARSPRAHTKNGATKGAVWKLLDRCQASVVKRCRTRA